MGEEAQGHLEKGKGLLAKGDEPKAYKAFEKAAQTDPTLAEAHFLMAESAMSVPKLTVEHISAAYAKAAELEPKNPQYLSSYGAFLLNIGQWSKAEEVYNAAAEADEENPGWYYQEFGFEYYQAMQRHYEGQLNSGMLKEVRKKAATYMLRAVGIGPEDLKQYFG